jgi:protein-tyrosine kinase
MKFARQNRSRYTGMTRPDTQEVDNMAKYLDAMARAQQQREARQQKVPDAPEPVEESSGTMGPTPVSQSEPVGPFASELAYELEKIENVSQPRPPEALDEDSPAAGRLLQRDIKPPPGLHAGVDEIVIGMHDHKSPITEQVRHIRTNLETALGEYSARPIVITSPVSGDGKTLFTANLAAVLADDLEHQVILLDADMRKPDQHQLYGLPSAPGLAEYLKGGCSLDQIIHGTSLPNLQLIPAGHPPSKPTTLLQSERMVELLGELQKRYTWILFDTPPLLPVTDASVLARECIGLILVVRMCQTHATTIERAQNLLAETRLPVLGCILNDYTCQRRENAYYYKYYGAKEQKGGFIS